MMTEREQRWLLAMRDLRDMMYAPRPTVTGCDECEEVEAL